MTAGENLSTLCRRHTGLADGDIACLEKVAAALQSVSDLDNADVFIDCLRRDGETGVVVAEAHPSNGQSMYDGVVAGKLVMPENEPAVFRAFAGGAPVRDIFAQTQEDQTVLQAVAPIRNDAGAVIGVLIQERDVSESVRQDRRYRQLARMAEERRSVSGRVNVNATPPAAKDGSDSLAVKEVNHRVKNNLQLIASMLGLQARNSPHPEVKKAFEENIGKILGIASIYDVLTHRETGPGENGKRIFLRPILEKVCYTIGVCLDCGTESVTVNVGGGDVLVDMDKAVTIALVVNELVANAVKHAFPAMGPGAILVSIEAGNAYSSVTVADNGVGMPNGGEATEGVGMTIVRSLVAKLGGKLRIETNGGSRVIFDFRH